MTGAVVSRETLADSGAAKRRYVSGFRRKKRDRTAERIVEAVLRLVEAGDFQPSLCDVAQRASCTPGAIRCLFGTRTALLDQVATQHWARVAKAAGLFFIVHPLAQPYVVRLILTGRKPAP